LGPPRLDEDYLVLSTVHSAKGLEWDAVHLIAAYDGNFPADLSTGTDEGIAEERRLFYVALTRPRRRLHVYVPARFYYRPGARDDAHGMGQASRFLTETVQSLFKITGSADVQWTPPTRCRRLESRFRWTRCSVEKSKLRWEPSEPSVMQSRPLADLSFGSTGGEISGV
jgi:ATP-dependent exoDNAse (exonuclease V) beta subunit